MSDAFDIDVGEAGVNENIYTGGPGQSLPTYAWHSRVDEQNHWGYWTVDTDSFADVPEFAEESEIRRGPTETQPVYATFRLRAAVIAFRRRWVIETPDNQRYFVPWFTRKEDKPEGKPTGHVQVLIRIPDDDVLRVIGLRGMTKGVSWDNNPNAQYGYDKFPKGVQQIVSQYAADATEYLREHKGYSGPPLPWMCGWWIDLVPATEEDKKGKPQPLHINVGHGIWVNPFTADMRTGKTKGKVEMPASRFVGPDLFKEFQRLRTDTGLDWEAEWAEAGVQEDQSGGFDGGGGEYVPTEEDDEIPF